MTKYTEPNVYVYLSRAVYAKKQQIIQCKNYISSD